jgi:hypothetical protein
MAVISPSGNRYESVAEWFESEYGIPKEECTPEWNIAYYTKLLSYTKHSVRRKKLKQELDWWIEMSKYKNSTK